MSKGYREVDFRLFLHFEMRRRSVKPSFKARLSRTTMSDLFSYVINEKIHTSVQSLPISKQLENRMNANVVSLSKGRHAFLYDVPTTATVNDQLLHQQITNIGGYWPAPVEIIKDLGVAKNTCEFV